MKIQLALTKSLNAEQYIDNSRAVKNTLKLMPQKKGHSEMA